MFLETALLVLASSSTLQSLRLHKICMWENVLEVGRELKLDSEDLVNNALFNEGILSKDVKWMFLIRAMKL